MQSRFLQQVILCFSLLLLSKAQHGTGSGPSCLLSSPAEHGQTRVTFLREDAAGVRTLYLTLWSEDRRPVACAENRNPLATERYRAICDRSATQAQEITQRFNISMLAALGAPCALVSSSAPKFARRARRDGTEAKARRKRAWIVPGTLWCGKGNEAVRYEQLGMFESTDRCCREHDHCLHVIPAFTVKYGVFNPNFYTVSGCDCDQRFRQCLLEVNDTISNMVGYSFFNILQVSCFELKEQKRCTKMYWWGMCKVAKKAPYAVFKSPLPYKTSDVTSKYGNNADNNNLTSSEGQHVTESPVTSPHRKSPKGAHRCGSRDPPRGDTFYRRRTKGKGCKKHSKLSTVAASQMPPVSRAHATTPSMNMGHLNASKSSSLMPSKKRAGKESKRKDRLAYPTKTSRVPQQGTRDSYPQTSSTTQSTPPSTQRKKLQLHLQTATTLTKTTKSHKKAPKQSRCCGSRMSVRGDTFLPHCKSCLEQETASHMPTVTAATTTNGLPVKVTTPPTMQLKKTTETPKQDTLKIPWNTTTFETPTTTKLKAAASLHKDGSAPKQMDSHLLENNTSQEPMGSTIASTHEERSLKQNNGLLNVTDNQLVCASLKHLDECKYQIPPLEKKYDLQNMESKTAYHCDCTNRLAVQIKSFKQPSTLPTPLMDFVSQYCFKLPKERKCHRRKSCSEGFIKASDLLRALKKIEEKDTAGMRNSGNNRKRGIPVRLYKRCLRLEREADIMAQLT